MSKQNKLRIAIYSSEGRIRKLIMFDTTNYKLKQDLDPKKVFAEIMKKHIRPARVLSSNDKNKEFFIFFNCNLSGFCPQPFLETGTNIWFIPMVKDGKKLSMSTKWVQDIIVLAKNPVLTTNAVKGRVRFDAGKTPSISRNFIVNHLDVLSETHQEKFIEGGNFLTGRDQNDEEIILMGKIPPDYDDEVRSCFRFKTRYNCYDPRMDPYSKLFFHLDFYMAFVGRYIEKATGKESKNLLLLTADHRYIYPKDKVDAPVPVLPQPLHGVKAVPFEMLSIPIPVFMRVRPKNKKNPQPAHIAESNKDILFALSYVNCIIENYFDEKDPAKRLVNVYMPDFTEHTQRFFVHKYMWKNYFVSLTSGIDGLIHYINGDENNAKTDGKKWFPKMPEWDKLNGIVDKERPAILEEILRNDFFNHYHEYITALLTEKIANCTVQFVPYNFFNLARRNGSLHCVTKVIERDLIG